ncbi:hypothetical protein [Acanthopleuribacter pedis]|uniref:Uncharacterized protein n=1 Tax=Acanthopleuribacter pedis TaxID=442870 RepID=A0A8J7QLA0_9BACT|nr:hypothetical protein [Acanthopleuribacter pedis]MBO1320050.1 hypothetical protein [Acanthopleuribacter pedis]
MLIKVNILCDDRWIAGKMDVPKIKKRFCKKHFGLVAALNFPHLSEDWPRVSGYDVLVNQASVRYFDGGDAESHDTLEVPLSDIQCAFEDATKETSFFETHFFEMVDPEKRLLFFCRSGLQIEGEFLDDVNEISLTKGRGFLSVANAMLASKQNRFKPQLMPFLTINQSLFVQIAKSRANAEQKVAEPEQLARCG